MLLSRAFFSKSLLLSTGMLSLDSLVCKDRVYGATSALLRLESPLRPKFPIFEPELLRFNLTSLLGSVGEEIPCVGGVSVGAEGTKGSQESLKGTGASSSSLLLLLPEAAKGLSALAPAWKEYKCSLATEGDR